MGQAARTTKLLLDLSEREQGGANRAKRRYLEETVAMLDALDLRKSFVRLKVYTGSEWTWVHYPTRYNRYFEQRRREEGWEQESPTLVLNKQGACIHFWQTKTITFAVRTRIARTRRHERLSKCASSILAVCSSLNVYAR